MGNEFWVVPAAKKPGHGADHPPLLAPELSLGRAIPLTPFCAFMTCKGHPVLHQLHETLSIVPTWRYNPHMKTSSAQMCDRELGIQKQCTVCQQGAGISASTVKHQFRYPGANMMLVHTELGTQCHGSLCSGCQYSETSHSYNVRQLFWHPGVNMRMYCCCTHSLAHTADRHTSQVASILKHARIIWHSVIFFNLFTLSSSLVGWNEFTQIGSHLIPFTVDCWHKLFCINDMTMKPGWLQRNWKWWQRENSLH